MAEKQIKMFSQIIRVEFHIFFKNNNEIPALIPVIYVSLILPNVLVPRDVSGLNGYFRDDASGLGDGLTDDSISFG